ncbi:hypothetical protein [Aestuariivivens insulae]|uniref:hypothetical protein n=1 Tax=Aestuariivivens insulae TaxID=1621988 RepID=UPI001F5AFAD3|nr:hypothetical protein [Aestuariivivens insulae]
MNKSIKFFSVLLILIFITTSCQDILECVLNRHPVLSDDILKIGQVNSYYTDAINAQIKNEPRDDDYYYYFSIDGDLPEGLEFVVDYRSVIIEGTPQESGRYQFTVRLSVEQVDDYYEDCENTLNDCDGLCKESTSKTYTLKIR